MKFVIFNLFFCLFISKANAEMILSFVKTCQSEEAKSLMDPKSSCHTVIVPKEVKEKSGSCTGLYNQSYPCKVSFGPKLGEFEILVYCTRNLQPVRYDSFSGEIFGFNAAGVIKKEDGKETIVNDSNDYFLITSEKMEIGFSEKKVNGVIKKEAYISTLTDVVCH